MEKTNKNGIYWTAVLLTLTLTACGGGGSSKTDNHGGGGDSSNTGNHISHIELVDPKPAGNDRFGSEYLVLQNGNIVIQDINESSLASDAGAIHLYNTASKRLISSYYGDNPDDFNVSKSLYGTTSSGGIYYSANGAPRDPLISAGSSRQNFVLNAFRDDINGVSNAGAVRLFSGATGEQIGATIGGLNDADAIGFSGVHALSNGNYVIASPLHDANDIADSGSVMLVDGNTGSIIGNPLIGDQAHDRIGYSDPAGYGGALNGIRPAENGNFFVLSQFDDRNGLTDAGSIALVDGLTGMVLGETIVGDDAGDQLGNSSIKFLSNGHALIYSVQDNHNGINAAGSIRLINTSTGAVIGGPFYGEGSKNSFGKPLFGYRIHELANGNLLIYKNRADAPGYDTVYYMLLNASTGQVINDNIECLECRIDTLSNGNIVNLGFSNQSSNPLNIELFDGDTGLKTGTTLTAADLLQSDTFTGSSVVPLENGNFLLKALKLADTGSSGSNQPHTIALVDGEDNSVIRVFSSNGEQSDFFYFAADQLENGNVCLRFPYFDANGMEDSGLTMLINPQSGADIGQPLYGLASNDRMGQFFHQFEASNYLIGSQYIDSDGLLNNGGILQVDANSNTPTGLALRGDTDYAELSDRSLLRFGHNTIYSLSEIKNEITRYDQNLASIGVPISLAPLFAAGWSKGASIGHLVLLPVDTGKFFLYIDSYQDNNSLQQSGAVYVLDF